MRGEEEEFGPAPTLTPIFPNSTYGPIEQWDTSQVTDMSWLFSRFDRNRNENPYCSTYATFNRNLTEWDVSRVTTMRCMFCSASAFNRDLSGWNIAQVRGRCRWNEG